jgi:hypothetical protein
MKKLTPASIVSQKKWAVFPLTKKKTLRKLLPDKDKDGVPNIFDCHPANRKRQEDFNSEDARYLAKKSEVKIGKKIDAGSYGSFHNIVGNKRLGVKVPHCRACKDDDEPCIGCTDKEDILSELGLCNLFDYNGRPLLMPARAITVDRKGRSCIGIAKPLITPLTYRNAQNLTDEQIESVRKALVSLANDGIGLKDGLQCGFTTSNRILQFDLGDVKKFSVDIAFGYNSRAWNNLLDISHKFYPCDIMPNDSASRRCYAEVYKKYGKVEQ